MTDVDRGFPQMTGEAVSKLMGFSPQWLKKLADQGYVERLENKLFDSGAVAKGYIRWLKDSARRNVKTEGQRRIQELQADKLELANAKALDALIEFEDARCIAAEMLAVIRENVTFAATQIEDPNLRSKILARLDPIFDRAEKRFADYFRELKANTPVLDHDNDDIDA